jgi:uncharacterized protein
LHPFSLLIKPSGSDCNLDCKYCFYKTRDARIGQGAQRMSDEVLEKLVKDYMQLGFENCGFAWQGGEPTLMGLDFYKKVVELQKKYGKPGQSVSNALQTNGLLLDDKWCEFLAENNFLVGISIDGPKKYHDYYRLDHSGKGTFERIVKAINKCREYKVEYNTLTLLNDQNVEHPEEIFDFLLGLDVDFMQFIPCVELSPESGEVADFSITPQQYGEFLCRLFDKWYEHGVDKVSIRDFDSILNYCLTGRHTICTFGRKCADYIVIEHQGDAFCCDFFVEKRWRLGNIFETPIEKLASSDKKKEFAEKKNNLSNKCLVCRHLSVCRGGCMKDRAPFDKENYGRESYFCEGYLRFFDYTMPKFMQIAADFNAAQLNNRENNF